MLDPDNYFGPNLDKNIGKIFNFFLCCVACVGMCRTFIPNHFATMILLRSLHDRKNSRAFFGRIFAPIWETQYDHNLHYFKSLRQCSRLSIVRN